MPVQYVTEEEVAQVDMLLYLQQMAGIETTYEMALLGWRAMSEPAQRSIIRAYEHSMFLRSYKSMEGTNDLSSSKAPESNK